MLAHRSPLALAVALVLGLALMPGCDGNARFVNVNGTWLLKLELNSCPLPGFLRGGSSEVLSISVNQSGRFVDSNFVDPDGNQVDMEGTLVGSLFQATWQVHTPQGRQVYLNSEARLHESPSELTLDGFMIVADDDDAGSNCLGEQFEFWANVNPAPPPPAVAFAGNSSRVDVVDIATMTVLTTITNARAYWMALSPDGSRLYGSGNNNLISVSNALNSTLINNFDPSVGTSLLSPSELEPIAVSPDGSRVYVADESGSTAVFVIDTATLTVVDSATLSADEPENAVVSPDGRFLYIVDNSDVIKIDTSTLLIVGRAPAGSDAHGVALNATGTRVYTEGFPSSDVDVIDTATMTSVDTIVGGGSAYNLQLCQVGNILYGVNEGNELAVMDTSTNTLIQTVILSESSARGVTTTSDGSTILVATRRGLIKLDATTLLETGKTPVTFYRSVATAR